MHHSTWIGCAAPHCYNLNTTWKWAISYMLQPLCLLCKSLHFLLYRKFCGTQILSGHGDLKYPHTHKEQNPQVPSAQLTTLLTQLTQIASNLWTYIYFHISSINRHIKTILSQLNALFLLINLLICSTNFTSISMRSHTCMHHAHVHTFTHTEWIKLSLILTEMLVPWKMQVMENGL